MELTELFKKGENLADVEKARVRTKRDLLLATTAHHDANVAFAVALEDGAAPDVMLEAEAKQKTSGWDVNRLEKRLTELEKKHAELSKKARDELLLRLLQKVAATGEAYGASAATTAALGFDHVAAVDEVERNGFRRERAELEPFPTHVMDYSNSQTLNPALRTYEALDRWRYGIAALKRRLSGKPDAEIAPDGPTQPWSQRIGPGSPVDGRPRPRSTTGGWHS